MLLSGILHDADRMEQVVRLLVDAARVAAGALDLFPETTDLAELVTQVARQQSRDPDHPEVTFSGDAGPFFVDPQRMRSAVLASCEALVWWGTEGPIRFAAHREEEGLVVTASRRGGQGFTDAQLEELYAPRAPGTGGGSKIGLYVVRGVARAQGGDAVATVEGQDLVLTLRVPLPAGRRGRADRLARHGRGGDAADPRGGACTRDRGRGSRRGPARPRRRDDPRARPQGAVQRGPALARRAPARATSRARGGGERGPHRPAGGVRGAARRSSRPSPRTPCWPPIASTSPSPGAEAPRVAPPAHDRRGRGGRGVPAAGVPGRRRPRDRGRLAQLPGAQHPAGSSGAHDEGLALRRDPRTP